MGVRISDETREEICRMRAEGLTVRQLTDRFEVSEQSIRNILNEKKWSDDGVLVQNNPFLGKGSSIGYQPKTEEAEPEVEAQVDDQVDPEETELRSTEARERWVLTENLQEIFAALTFDRLVRCARLTGDDIRARGVFDVERMTIAQLKEVFTCDDAKFFIREVISNEDD